MTHVHLAHALVIRDGAVLMVASRYANHVEPIWNLPGGRQQFGELLSETAQRELFEETGIVADVAEVQLFQTLSVPDGRYLLVFGLLQPRRASELPAFVPCEEVLEVVVVKEPIELVFPLHTQVMRDFFAGRRCR